LYLVLVASANNSLLRSLGRLVSDARVHVKPQEAQFTLGLILLPADRIVLAYNTILAMTWLFVSPRLWYAPWLVLAHIAGIGLVGLFLRLPDSARSGMRLLRDLYPLILVAAFWTELDLVRPVLDLVGVDSQIAALDLFLFGGHLHETWLPRMGAVWMSEVMHFFYYAYCPSIYILAIAVAVLGKQDAVRDTAFRLSVTYFSCFVIYIVFPVDGPHFLMVHTPGAHTEGFFYGLVQMAQTIGDSRGCSFPSSHVAGATTIAVLAWRWLPRWAAVILTVEALGVLLSTTYTQHHYFVDSVAGLAWALLFNFVLAAPLLRALGGDPSAGSDSGEKLLSGSAV